MKFVNQTNQPPNTTLQGSLPDTHNLDLVTLLHCLVAHKDDLVMAYRQLKTSVNGFTTVRDVISERFLNNIQAELPQLSHITSSNALRNHKRVLDQTSENFFNSKVDSQYVHLRGDMTLHDFHMDFMDPEEPSETDLPVRMNIYIAGSGSKFMLYDKLTSIPEIAEYLRSNEVITYHDIYNKGFSFWWDLDKVAAKYDSEVFAVLKPGDISFHTFMQPSMEEIEIGKPPNKHWIPSLHRSGNRKPETERLFYSGNLMLNCKNLN